MTGPRLARALALAAAIAGGAWLASCGKHAALLLTPNQRPTVRITQAPSVPTQPYFYAYELRWAGFDADGRVDHFRYCIDPPTAAVADTPWVSTTDNRKVFLFRSDQVANSTDLTAEGYHTIVIEAVDDRGAVSAPDYRSVTSFTIAPMVQITSPELKPLFGASKLGPSFRIAWVGSDPDGRTTTKPVKYKIKLFSDADPLFSYTTVILNPDTLRKAFAPTFAGWDSVSGDTTWFDYRNLVPGRKCVVVVIAIDEAGAYSPVINQNTNLANIEITLAGLAGPAMTVYGDGFYHASLSGSFSTDAASFITVEDPADQPITFHWSAIAATGGFVQGYRWMLDGDVGDEAPRTDEATDLVHWSQYSPTLTAATLGPFSPPPGQTAETHYLYVEAQDNNAQLSLAVVQFTVVRAAFDHDLLMVDDARLAPDRLISPGVIDRPRGQWPTMAELDTFFYARGGVPWRTYPAGTLSPVGIFQGYRFDTLGTRFLPNATLTLNQLGHYRNIVWFTDYASVLNPNPPTSAFLPMPLLEWISSTEHQNVLAEWVAMGGHLWLMGGGVAGALQRNWEKSGTAANVFSFADGELVPGRMMYDQAGWRSEITENTVAQAGLSDRLPAAYPGRPDYTLLPPYLFEKSPTSDPVNVEAPNRTNSSDFYQSAFFGEALTKDNSVSEVDASGIAHATLDTLYTSVGGSLGASRPIMTYYHGSRTPPLVFSGFPLWYWRRADQIALVDFVLQNVWGLTRQPIPR